MKARRALADLDGPQLPRPGVDVLEQAAVGLGPSRQVERTLDGVVREFHSPSQRELIFLVLESGSLTFVEEIPQDRGAGVDVRVDEGVSHGIRRA